MKKLKDIKGNKLVIFDLDDTIIKTDAKIKIIDRKTGVIIRELSPKDFNLFKTKSTHILDFDDFNSPEILRQGKFIFSIFDKLKEYYNSGIPVAILTARSSSKLVREFSFLVYLIEFISDFLVHTVQVLLLVSDLLHLDLRLSELVILIGHEGRCAIGYSCQDNVLAHVY